MDPLFAAMDNRAGPLEWVGSRLDVAVKSVPLTKSGKNWFELASYESGLTLESEEPAGGIEEAYRRARLAELDRCLSALEDLRSTCESHFGESAPRFDGLRSSLKTVSVSIEQLSANVESDSTRVATAGPIAAGCTAASIDSELALDRVHFTVTAPSQIQPAASAVVTFWVHLESQRAEVIDRANQQYRRFEGADFMSISKGPVRIARGAILTLHLDIKNVRVEDPDDSIPWEGEIGCANFVVTIPASSQRTFPGRALVYLNGLQVAKVQFVLQVATTATDDSISTTEARIQRAFASYASPDRDEVLGRLQGIRKAAPYIEIFFDVLTLQSGQSWQNEIERLIDASDVFYLFWSLNARASEQVEQEWRTALGTGRPDFIDPVPLQPAEEAPPPPELASLHFNDWMLAFQRRTFGSRTSQWSPV